MRLELGDGLGLRQAAASDHQALCRVCLRTGDAGRDATAREDDPDLLGQIYAVPYQLFEPDFAFVVDGPSGVCGYLFGALDTAAFNARLAKDWYPQLRRRVPAPDSDRSRWRGSDWARHLIHHPQLEAPAGLAAFPSHGHIDLLPEVRGRGIGRRIMSLLERRLGDAGSAGLHLELDPRNDGAQRFYAALGFDVLPPNGLRPHSLFMGKRLERARVE